MAVDLKSYTVKDLAEMAKKRGVAGWHSMKKDQLVRAIKRATAKKSRPAAKSSSRSAGSRKSSKSSPKAASRKSSTKASRKSKSSSRKLTTTASRNGSTKAKKAKPQTPRQQRQLNRVKEKLERSKNLAFKNTRYTKDRLVVMVRDPYWLHAYWELTSHGVQRAEAALGQQWHTARPVLRLIEISNPGTTTSSETVVRNIQIHGGVNNWYIDVQDPPKTYRMEVGYLSANGTFFMLAKSNKVSTPRAGASDTLDENWTDVAENFEKIYAMSGGYAPDGPSTELQKLFEERLRRPMGSPLASAMSVVPNGKKRREFTFNLDAELIVYGATEPNARVTLQGDPVQLRPDGTFTVRFSLPDCRQIIPAVAASADGTEQRTIVLAVERNTKTMEPVMRDNDQ